MRIAVGLLMCLGGLSTAWGDEPPAAPQPAAAPSNQQASPSASPGKPAPDGAPAAATSAPAATATATTSKPESAAATQSSPKTLQPDDEKNLLSHGYKIEMRNGQKLFCRKETPTGTRFPEKICRTEQQMASVRQNSKDYLNDVQRPSGNPPGK